MTEKVEGRDTDELTGLRRRPPEDAPASAPIGVAARTDRDRQRLGRPVIIPRR